MLSTITIITSLTAIGATICIVILARQNFNQRQQIEKLEEQISDMTDSIEAAAARPKEAWRKSVL